jgi:hypothetical protein
MISQATRRCITEDCNLKIHVRFLLNLHYALIECYRLLIDSSADETLCVAYGPNTEM